MIVEIKNLVKRYKDFLAVDNINLSVREGEIFGFLGPNGAGKTTTINMIMGLAKIDKGEIKVFGKDMREHEMEIKKEIGIVPQELSIFNEMSAYENVLFFGRLYGLKAEALKEKAEEALNFVGLWDKRKDYSKNFSGGMKRRLNIACAIVHQPKLIIMDEPTVGVDPQSRNHILNSVRKLNAMGSTIIYTSHYMEEIEDICTKIAIMDHGRIIIQGTKDELKSMILNEEKVVMELSSLNYSVIETVKAIKNVEECIVDGNQLTVLSQKGSRNLGSIIEAVGNAESDIICLNVEKPTLEGVFLTLTGRTLRDL